MPARLAVHNQGIDRANIKKVIGATPVSLTGPSRIAGMDTAEAQNDNRNSRQPARERADDVRFLMEGLQYPGPVPTKTAGKGNRRRHQDAIDPIRNLLDGAKPGEDSFHCGPATANLVDQGPIYVINNPHLAAEPACRQTLHERHNLALRSARLQAPHKKVDGPRIGRKGRPRTHSPNEPTVGDMIQPP